MSGIIHFFFEFQTNIKLYHWMTLSYARHKAADELVEKMIDYSDTFMEVYIGKYGRPTLLKKNNDIHLQKLDDENVTPFLDKAINFMLKELPKYLKETDVDLFNIRDEIVSTLYQSKYLFTLQ
jgi:hypothetical protein